MMDEKASSEQARKQVLHNLYVRTCILRVMFFQELCPGVCW